MTTEETTTVQDERHDRRMVTIDKVAGVGEVVTYATTDRAKLQAIAKAQPADVTYQATWEMLEKATSHEVVHLRRGGKLDVLDTYGGADGEHRARAFVRGMVKAAEVIAARRNGKRGS